MNSETPGRARRIFKPETQTKREIARLKAEVRKHIKLAKMKKQAESLRSLLIDIGDMDADRINPFDIEQALRNGERFNR